MTTVTEQAPRGATDADIEYARALRAQTLEQIEETRTFRTAVLEPLWDRLTARAVHNSFGEEFTLTMEPRGSAPE